MSVLDRLAHSQGRKDEVPNQELARDLAAARDSDGIREIAENLRNPDRNIQNDCVKVLYEVGEIEPELIADYAEHFVELLASKNNRLVWGAMTALGAIAPLQAELLCEELDRVVQAFETGSVITQDHGVRVLAALAGSDSGCKQMATQHLFQHLESCRPKDVPQRSESALPAIDSAGAPRFAALLERRPPELSAAQARRVRKVLDQVRERMDA